MLTDIKHDKFYTYENRSSLLINAHHQYRGSLDPAHFVIHLRTSMIS
jgi:hypothetical protein